MYIVGKKGNEGKTFLQNYILRLYGSKRVVDLEISGKSKDIRFLLTRDKMLQGKDIFMFNLPRMIRQCFSNGKDFPCDILENIKDSQLTNLKYRGKKYVLKTPNCLLVFNNKEPKISFLSSDRFLIRRINSAGHNLL